MPVNVEPGSAGVSPSPEAARAPAPALRDEVTGVVRSLRRLADLQLAIWLAGVKSAVLRMAIFMGLGVIALVLAIAAIPFLYAGIYRLLTDILHIQPAWALLIFAGVHLLLAGVLAFAALRILNSSGGAAKSAGDVK